MEKLKYTLTITSTSFMLVVLFNAIMNYGGSFSTLFIFEIFVTCLMIGVVTVCMDSIHLVKEHTFLFAYIAMLLIVFTMEIIFQRKFDLSSFILEFIFLSFVYLGVFASVHFVHDYEASKINEKIKERRQRKLK